MTEQLTNEGDEFKNQPTIECAVASCNCDKYGHPLARDLVVCTTRAPNRLNVPSADRFGHLCGPRNGTSGGLEQNAFNSRNAVIR
jgi:hypothetical protein